MYMKNQRNFLDVILLKQQLFNNIPTLIKSLASYLPLLLRFQQMASCLLHSFMLQVEYPSIPPPLPHI